MIARDTLTLGDVIAACQGLLPVGYRDLDRVIANVRIDSRDVQPGDLFVALPGTSTDGHVFVRTAFEKGARAALVTRLVPDAPANATLIQVPDTLKALHQIAAAWRQRFAALRVIGVTGSIGKTSTKELVAQVLSQRFNTLKSEGNLNSETGLPLQVLRLRSQHQRAVFEMGMFALGEIRALCDIARPNTAVVTKIEPVHLERLGSIENIVRAKSELVESITRDGIAVLNDDDDRVRNMMARNRGRTLLYGTTPRADVWADQIESHGLDGISLTLHHKKEVFHIRVPLLGAHSAYTVLRAATVGIAEGMAWDEIIGALREPGAQLRLVALQGPFDSIVLDDRYNASGESVLAALNLLDQLDKPRIAVLGEMYELGDESEHQHRMVGCRAAGVAQHIVTLGPHAKWIAQEAVACGAPAANVHQCTSHEQVLDVLARLVTRKSVVLFKGSRGLEMEQIVNQFVVKGDE